MTKKISTRWFCCFLVVSLVMGMSGCGGGDSGPPLYQAGGKVTLDGQPVSGATVALVTEDSGSSYGQSILGTTDDKGEFTLSTNYKPGAPAGEFIVTIFKYEGSAVAAGGEGEDKTIPKNAPYTSTSGPMAEMIKKQVKEKGEKFTSSKTDAETSKLPAAYADRNLKKFTATVSSNPEKNNFTFDMVTPK